MTFNPQTDIAICPHCKDRLDHWTLDLWQCPSDKTVFDASTFRPISESVPDYGTSGGPGHDTTVIAADHLPLCSIAGKCD